MLGGEDADAGGKGAVEGAMEIGGGDGAAEGEAGDLGEGVDAGVGAAGALREDDLAGDVVEGGASVPWTVGRPGWTCQPWKGVPS